MDDLSIADFAPYVGEAYEAATEAGPVALTLEAASAQPGGMRPSGAFRLTFRGPADPILPQAIYSMRRGDRRADIFIVPVGRSEAGTEYEAVFF